MKIEKSIANIKIVLSIVLIVAILFLISFGPAKIAYAADNVSGSDVLQDLHTDESFDESNYPSDYNDYSLKLIQIAETTEKELVVYVYQPSGIKKDYKATSINISTTINDEISYHNYKLSFLNSSGVFYKYRVDEFIVKDEPVRYYAISSIYRAFDDTVDEQASGGNQITEVDFEVARQYCFGSVNGNSYVNCVDLETIVVTSKFVGFVRYPNGFKFCVSSCDSHFVAFDTDKPIDKLLEADVYYTTQQYVWQSALGTGAQEYFKDKSDEYAYLKYTDKVEHTGDGLFAGTYKWDRIQSVDAFVASVDFEKEVYSGAIIDVKIASKITDEAKQELQSKKWVLRFAETPYELSGGVSGTTTERSTIVGDVTILRLKFETDGVVYNLGVIDNKQSGSRDPINVTDTIVELSDTLKYILGIMGLILIAVAIVVLCVVVKPIGAFLKFIFKVIWTIISAPFKFIAWLFRSDKK